MALEVGITTRSWLEKQLPKLFGKQTFSFKEEMTLAVTKVALNNREFNARSKQECDLMAKNIISMVEELTASCE